jgi:hypothetical protein
MRDIIAVWRDSTLLPDQALFEAKSRGQDRYNGATTFF